MTSPNPLANIDPRILAVIQAAQSKSAPIDTTPSAPSTATIPDAPPPPAVASQPLAATQPVVSMPQPAPDAPQPAQSTIPITPATVPPPTPAKPGPVKSLLSSFLFGTGQAMLKHVGLPTEQEKAELAQRQAIEQQTANDLSAQRQGNTAVILQKAAEYDRQRQPYVIPNDPETFGSLAGTPTTVGQFEKLSPTILKALGATNVAGIKADSAETIANTKADNVLALQNLKVAGGDPARHVLKSIGGQIYLVDKGNGSYDKNKPLGIDTAMITGPRNADARAYAQAKYNGNTTLDSEQNPTFVSRLQQLQAGAPTVTAEQAQNLAGDKVGVQTYLTANQRVRDNLYVLQDNTQRAIIARATEAVKRDPGAYDSIINSEIQKGLTPQGAVLIAGLKQMGEFGAAFKRYTGNSGVATDSLRSTIAANQPSTSNDIAVNQNLLSQDEQLARQVQGVLGKISTHTVPAKGGAPSKPSAPASNLPAWDKGPVR